jgi:hypothetical protein
LRSSAPLATCIVIQSGAYSATGMRVSDRSSACRPTRCQPLWAFLLWTLAGAALGRRAGEVPPPQMGRPLATAPAPVRVAGVAAPPLEVVRLRQATDLALKARGLCRARAALRRGQTGRIHATAPPSAG